jgi:hypothetical protein
MHLKECINEYFIRLRNLLSERPDKRHVFRQVQFFILTTWFSVRGFCN